ncbi:MAG TPA: ACT domain-containing protein [Chryseolinea sp.]|nr:ACT domain-containing protein [Chryseolinea sp.]
MNGETDLAKILKTLKPKHIAGDYVFCAVDDLTRLNLNDIVFFFREKEGITIVLKKELADKLKLEYAFVAAWITLTVHSSLESVGLTAAFSKELSENGISCNVVAALHHDHIFVPKKDGEKALKVLKELSDSNHTK